MVATARWARATGPWVVLLVVLGLLLHVCGVAEGFAGNGGFSLSELPEDVFEEAATASSGSSSDFSDIAVNGKRSSAARVAGGGGSRGGLASQAALETLRTGGQKALVPSLVVAAAGATGRVLQKRYGPAVAHMWQEHKAARQLRQEKKRLEREIKEEQRRYQQEMRRMTEEQEREESKAMAASEAEMEAEAETRRARVRDTQAAAAAATDEDEGVSSSQPPPQQPYRPDLKKTQKQPPLSRRSATELQSMVSQLEDRVQALQNEVASKADQASRAQASKAEELNNARSVVEQLRKELEDVRGTKEHMQEQLRQYQVRMQTLKDQQEKGGNGGALSTEDVQRLKADVEAELRQEFARAKAQEKEAWAKEVRHQTMAEITAQSKAERSKFESDLVDLYRRRLKDEVGKRDTIMEERLHAQDVEYRRQCEELRLKVHGLLRERDHSMREKVALHAREWQERVGGAASAGAKRGQQLPVRAPAGPSPPGGMTALAAAGRRKGLPQQPLGGSRGVPPTYPHRMYHREGEEGNAAMMMDAEEAEARAATRAVGVEEEEGEEEALAEEQRRLRLLHQQRQQRAGRAAAGSAEQKRRYPTASGSRKERV